MPSPSATWWESSYLVHRLATEHGRDARMIPDWIGTTRLTAIRARRGALRAALVGPGL